MRPSCLTKYQEREEEEGACLYMGSPLRFYPDLSSALARKRAEYNGVKQALYKKGVRFRLMHPARLVVTFEAQTFTFDSPEEAQEFYKRRVAKE
ncbi:hypothetical protein NHX12_016971 [Muraenolepis orangiensis]|uniref:Uncharacterized protein n=1 Tax=Muraenolepis orangiensis TaxID=630683 RepID=A0A9Q0D571_9TELE|nr:hypothetical protein NHX12_016971 [Muraenolepis orangiensis]